VYSVSITTDRINSHDLGSGYNLKEGNERRLPHTDTEQPGFHHGGENQNSSEKSKPAAKQGHKVTDPFNRVAGLPEHKNLLGGFYT
jgi:hypothetical protein